MKVLHAGDLHVWRIRIPFSDPFAPKRWLGGANLIARRAALFPASFREPLLKALYEENPELILFTGDFTQASQTKEFLECSRLFEPLRKKLGDRLIAIPGNHDVYTRASVKRQFLENGLPWVRVQPVTRTDLEGTLTVITVNHSRPYLTKSNGLVTPETHELLCQTLSECQADNRTVILAGHYPFVTPPEHPETPHHKLIGDELLLEAVREFSPALYLHGHKHVRWGIRHSDTPDTLCLNCGSLGMKSQDPMKQAGFLSWDQQEDGTIRELTAHRLTDQGEMVKQSLEVREV